MLPALPAQEQAAGRSLDGAERRNAVRRTVSIQATCTSEDDPAGAGIAWQARLRDISEMGAGLWVPVCLEEGELFELDLSEASRGTLGKILVRVVHLDLAGPGSWIVGCAFVTELSEHDLRCFQAEKIRSTGPDSRRWVRFPCNVETVCTTCETAPGERRQARIVNVSAGGIGLMLPCEFATGTLLRFEMPSDQDQPAGELFVRVVRVLEHGRGQWFLGCEFVHRLNADELRLLVRDRPARNSYPG